MGSSPSKESSKEPSKEATKTESGRTEPAQVVLLPSFARNYELRDPEMLRDKITKYGQEHGVGPFECYCLIGTKTNKHFPQDDGKPDKTETIDYILEAGFKVVDELTNPDPLFPSDKQPSILSVLFIVSYRRGQSWRTDIHVCDSKAKSWKESKFSATNLNKRWFGNGLNICDRSELEDDVKRHIGPHLEEIKRCIQSIQATLLYDTTHWTATKPITPPDQTTKTTPSEPHQI